MDEISTEEILRWAETVYLFVMTTMENMKQPHDYGTGEVLNMVEMHTLDMIASAPGLCVTDVARLWNRTLGAASRNVDRLQNKGLIRKEKMAGNDKNIHLYPTEAGRELAALHGEYDRRGTKAAVDALLLKHDREELTTAFRVVSTLQQIMEHNLGRVAEVGRVGVLEQDQQLREPELSE